MINTEFINKFKNKEWLSPMDYYLYIAHEAITEELMTEKEFKIYTSGFLAMRLSPPRTVQALETIIKLRYEDRMHRLSTEAQSKDSFFDGIINAKPKRKK